MKTLFLRPVDVWMFRDGRPFDAGSAHRAESTFPPYPSVIQGAIRTHRLLKENIGLNDKEEIEKRVGTADDYKELQIRGPFVAKMEDGGALRYFPQPADAILEGETTLKPASLSTTESLQNRTILSHFLPYLIGFGDSFQKQKESIWLSETALNQYLEGVAVEGIRESDLFVRENRTGIGMENEKRVVREGMLYEAEFIRPHQNIGLLIEVGGQGYDDFPDSGILQLGGESRSAWFETVKVIQLPSPKKGKRGYKVYFASPAYFNDGWQSDWNKLFGCKVELMAAAIGRCESMGGFDRANKYHKAADRYVPAGSVYYFESQEECTVSQLTDKNQQIGFGQVIIKEW